METTDQEHCLNRVHNHAIDTLHQLSLPLLPTAATLTDSRTTLLPELPRHGVGLTQVTDHLLKDVAPALNGASLSPNYYGFVTGGTTPAARIGEALVSLYDQNPLVHLPDQTVASNVEDKALRLLMDLFHFDHSAWSGVFTTGATASNVLGLACGREFIVNERLKGCNIGDVPVSLGSLGLLRACSMAGIEEINIYTTMAHSSLYKAASILGIGRSAVKDCQRADSGLHFDFPMLEDHLASNHDKKASIVVISCAEVNTGLFATSGFSEVSRLKRLCHNYGAWLHVDGAFGLFGRVLKGLPEFEVIADGCEGLELADSIAGDGHKLLNVPYDCGLFFCRSPGIAPQVFQNPNAAYLNTASAATDAIQSPLNIGIENSRRFRGLPVYATLMAYGRNGYLNMLERQIRFARSVALYLFQSDAFDLLPQEIFVNEASIAQHVFIIVLFRAKDEILNEDLVSKINTTSKVYVSGTKWKGSTATRIAVSNWQVQPDRDMEIVRNVLENTLKDYAQVK